MKNLSEKLNKYQAQSFVAHLQMKDDVEFSRLLGSLCDRMLDPENFNQDTLAQQILVGNLISNQETFKMICSNLDG